MSIHPLHQDQQAPIGFLKSKLDFETELCEIDDCAYLCTLFFIEGQPAIRLTRQLKGVWRTDFYLYQFMMARAENREFEFSTPTDGVDCISHVDLRRIVERALATLIEHGRFAIQFYEYDPEIPF